MATKRELTEQIAEQLGFKDLSCKRIVQAFLDAMIHELQEQGRLELRGFGTFIVTERTRTEYRNPSTGEPITVPPSKTVTFRPSKLMEENVNG